MPSDPAVNARQNNFVNNGVAVAHYGGSAIDASRCYWGNEDGPTGATNGVSGTVTFQPVVCGRRAHRPPRRHRHDTEISGTPDLYRSLRRPRHDRDGGPTGSSLSADTLELAAVRTLMVNGGELDLGQGSVISGIFTIFNSFGSWDIDGDN